MRAVRLKSDRRQDLCAEICCGQEESDDRHDDGAAGRTILKRALRPVILRRTKQQVAPDEGGQRILFKICLTATRQIVLLN